MKPLAATAPLMQHIYKLHSVCPATELGHTASPLSCSMTASIASSRQNDVADLCTPETSPPK